MKHKVRFHLVILMLAVVANSCQKIERDNPWDEKAKNDPDAWAPSNLLLTINDTTSISLKWEQTKTVEGFKIERKKEDGAWELVTSSIDGSQRQYVDAAVTLPAIYAYRVFAFAGKNTSSYADAELDLPTVFSTEITNISGSTATSGGYITGDGGFAVTARGVVWSSSQNPSVTDNQGITSDGTGISSFISELTSLTPSTIYYLRAYATNIAGTHYGNELSFSTKGGLPVLTTAKLTAITATSATSGGNITSDGGFAVTARGVVWSSSQNPTITNNQGLSSDGSGVGSFSSNITNLQAGTVYFVRAYAINSKGTHYGDQLSFTTTGTAVNEVTNPATGKTWMDRNLGASQAATSSADAESYGDLYQWGRLTDGHEKRMSATTTVISSSDIPGHENFIIVSNVWRSPNNDNLWQGVNGINNPCPTNYRIPTEAEWTAEIQSWSSYNAVGAFNSPLKLPVAGDRSSNIGTLYDVGTSGHYWSASLIGTPARSLYFSSGGFNMLNNNRASGRSVRCIKD